MASDHVGAERVEIKLWNEHKMYFLSSFPKEIPKFSVSSA
jgi:hypothetical protein